MLISFVQISKAFLNKIDYEQFSNELYDILQNKLSHNSINIHQKFDTLVGTFKNLPDKHAPLIRQSRRERKLAQKPWITKAIMVSIRQKNRFFSKICKNPLLRMHTKNMSIYSHG